MVYSALLSCDEVVCALGCGTNYLDANEAAVQAFQADVPKNEFERASSLRDCRLVAISADEYATLRVGDDCFKD
jgi:hypothetical protein